MGFGYLQRFDKLVSVQGDLKPENILIKQDEYDSKVEAHRLNRCLQEKRKIDCRHRVLAPKLKEEDSENINRAAAHVLSLGRLPLTMFSSSWTKGPKTASGDTERIE